MGVTVRDSLIVDVVAVRIQEAPIAARAFDGSPTAPQFQLHAVGVPAGGAFLWQNGNGATVQTQGALNTAGWI